MSGARARRRGVALTCSLPGWIDSLGAGVPRGGRRAQPPPRGACGTQPRRPHLLGPRPSAGAPPRGGSGRGSRPRCSRPCARRRSSRAETPASACPLSRPRPPAFGRAGRDAARLLRVRTSGLLMLRRGRYDRLGGSGLRAFGGLPVAGLFATREPSLECCAGSLASAQSVALVSPGGGSEGSSSPPGRGSAGVAICPGSGRNASLVWRFCGALLIRRLRDRPPGFRVGPWYSILGAAAGTRRPRCARHPRANGSARPASDCFSNFFSFDRISDRNAVLGDLLVRVCVNASGAAAGCTARLSDQLQSAVTDQKSTGRLLRAPDLASTGSEAGTRRHIFLASKVVL